MTAGTYQNFSRANNERFARLRRGLAIFDVRVFRTMISSGSQVYLYAGAASSSYELPDEGNERDHEQEVNQSSGHVEHNEAK